MSDVECWSCLRRVAEWVAAPFLDRRGRVPRWCVECAAAMGYERRRHGAERTR